MKEQTNLSGAWLTFLIALVGLVVALITLLVAVLVFSNRSNPETIIPAITAPITTLVGTVVGLVAGHATGAAGTAQAEKRADTAQQRLNAVAAVQPTALQEAISKYPYLFPETGTHTQNPPMNP